MAMEAFGVAVIYPLITIYLLIVQAAIPGSMEQGWEKQRNL